MKEKIINILSDGDYHDGSTIGNSLGITRSAVWKAIQRLRSYGLEITSIKGKGYRLQEPLLLLDPNLILKKCQHKCALEVFDSIGSTNDHLKKPSAAKQPRICLAEQQTQGRGRLGRHWFSPFAQNIYLSCRYSFQKDISGLAGLSLVVGLSLIEALKKHLPADQTKIKWPNDILFQDKKLAGILIDIQAEAHGQCAVIIGIGLNVNMLRDQNHQIPQAWTSMRKIAGNYIDRNEVAATIINTLLTHLERFAKQGLTDFTNEWKIADYLFGKSITIKSSGEKISGIANGIDPVGQLQLTLPDGTQRAFSSGDTSFQFGST